MATHRKDGSAKFSTQLAEIMATIVAYLNLDNLLLKILAHLRKPRQSPPKVFIGHLDSAARYAKAGCVLLGPVSRLVPDLVYYGAPPNIEVVALIEYRTHVTLKIGGVIQQVVQSHDKLDMRL